MNSNIPSIGLPRIVIIGCGFAGLKLVKKINTKNYEKRLRTEFQDIDIFLSFSNIIFNEEKTKAFLIVGVSYENLNGFSTLIYLEKEYYHWTIKCKKILSIS